MLSPVNDERLCIKMNVALLLSPKIGIACLDYNSTVRQGIEKFRAHGYTAVPVLTEDGFYMGTVSEGDFLRYILGAGEIYLKDAETHRISDIMRKDSNPPLSIDAGIDDLVRRLMDSNFVPIVDGRGCFVGIVTRKNMLTYMRYMLESDGDEVSDGDGVLSPAEAAAMADIRSDA